MEINNERIGRLYKKDTNLTDNEWEELMKEFYEKELEINKLVEIDVEKLVQPYYGLSYISKLQYEMFDCMLKEEAKNFKHNDE